MNNLWAAADDLRTHASGYVAAKDFGAKGDGTTDDTTAIQAAISAIGTAAQTLWITGVSKVGALTFPKNIGLQFQKGAALSVNAGAVVSILGPVTAAPERIFSGAGRVTLGLGMPSDPRWFGRWATFDSDFGTILHVFFDKPGAWNTLYGSRGEVVTVVRSTTATLLMGGVESTAAINQGRVDEDGLIVEPASTNIVTSPTNFAGAGWTAGQVTAVTGATAPDGTTSAFTVTDNTTVAAHQLYVTPTFTTADWAWSVYAKAGTLSWIRLADNSAVHVAFFNLSTGKVGTVGGTGSRGEIESVGNGWYRCALIAPETAGGSLAAIAMSPDGASASYAGTGSTIFLWRAQLEANEYATTWTATTRAAEHVVVPLPTLGGEWTVEIDAMPMGAQRWDRSAHLTLAGIGQQNTANSIEVYTNAGTLVGLVTDASTVTKSVTTSALASGSTYLGPRRLAVSSDGVGRPAAFIDGRQTTTAPAGTGTGLFVGTGAGQTILYIGSILGGTSGVGVSHGGFKIRGIKVTNTRRPPWRPEGATSYAWAMPRGYLASNHVLAFLGDSITQGTYDVSITTPFPFGVAATLGASYTAHDFGIGANTSEMILQRWRADVRNRGYSTLVLLAGINDVNAYIPSATTIANLDSIISEALSDGMKVVVSTLLPGGKPGGDPMRANLDAVNTWIRARAGITVVDSFADFDDGTGKIKVAWDIDGGSLHPNQTGQTELARIVSLVLP